MYRRVDDLFLNVIIQVIGATAAKFIETNKTKWLFSEIIVLQVTNVGSRSVKVFYVEIDSNILLINSNHNSGHAGSSYKTVDCDVTGVRSGVSDEKKCCQLITIQFIVMEL